MSASCDQCNGRLIVFSAKGARSLAAPCAACVCGACEGEGYRWSTHDGLTFSEPCPECSVLAHKCAIYNRASLPPRFAASSLVDYVPKSESQQIAKAWFWDKIESWNPGDRGLILSGDVGVGKTHLMTGFVYALCMHRSIPARFIEFSDLLMHIRAGYNRGDGDDKILNPLVHAPVLVIDELGKSQNTDWQQSILDGLITRRYNAGKSTFATTNYAFGNAATRSIGRPQIDDFRQRTLRDVIGARMYSRLVETCDMLTVEGPDHRATVRGRQ